MAHDISPHASSENNSWVKLICYLDNSELLHAFENLGKAKCNRILSNDKAQILLIILNSLMN